MLKYKNKNSIFCKFSDVYRFYVDKKKLLKYIFCLFLFFYYKKMWQTKKNNNKQTWFLILRNKIKI